MCGRQVSDPVLMSLLQERIVVIDPVTGKKKVKRKVKRSSVSGSRSRSRSKSGSRSRRSKSGAVVTMMADPETAASCLE
jgi:hypothetical protein